MTRIFLKKTSKENSRIPSRILTRTFSRGFSRVSTRIPSRSLSLRIPGVSSLGITLWLPLYLHHYVV